MAMAAFFDQVPAIKLHDGLSELLGATDDGIVEFHYADAARLAGHSCPTVAGAWLVARAGLKALYGDELPERGDVQVAMPEAEDEGVTGVIAQVLTLVTGATARNGFHGLGGQYQRSHLLEYASGDFEGVRMTRTDNGATVEVQYSPRSVPADPEQMPLLRAILQGMGDVAAKRRFAGMWQGRVRRILLEHADDPSVIRARRIN